MAAAGASVDSAVHDLCFLTICSGGTDVGATATATGGSSMRVQNCSIWSR